MTDAGSQLVRNDPTHKVWACMRQRCFDEKTPNYHLYGGRGIKVCERWNKFANFLEDMGERPQGHSLDRIHNDGDYSPENCRWATHKEQANNKRNSVIIELNGTTKTLTQWIEYYNLNPKTVWSRYREQGWSIEKSLNLEGGKQHG